ncbi:diguanylate cyclase domain-containing protein [Cognaticolwellia mytili]|uniref:diguanylate cyclase domain-containing protein n=1 Tax=Cognaticolwellia mytili TaxID=1888913 RepID=UPI000A1739A4|nr:diguanylate cyclase [Cognaticolwellia mytili]
MKSSHIKAITTFTLLFMLMAVISLFAIKKLQYSASTALATRTATVLASTITQARVSYSKNAVAALRAHPDISVQSQYHDTPYAIPNPATFAIELGEAISAPEKGLILHTFSNYPFKSRQSSGGPKDSFQKTALQKLSKNNHVFERVEMFGETNVLRHAEPIFMEQSCVDCHNKHPESPKKDWQVGDMRGAIDITIPLSTDDEELTKTVQYAYVIFIAFSVIGLLCMFVTLKRTLNLSSELERKVKKRTAVLSQLARTDSLTSIANRRHFEEFAQALFNSQSQVNRPVALLIYDLDYFKNVNDTYGHDMGDECLKAVVNTVNLALRSNQDFHARIGGEEFAIILQDISNEELQKFTEQILTDVSNIKISENADIKLTCSIGSTLTPYDNDTTMKKMMSAADQALYQAKSNGRNQAVHLNYEDV